MLSIKNLFNELSRRRVLRAAAVYGVIAWGVVEGADVVVPALGIPERVLTYLVVVALAGFPIVLAAAWIFDVTPRGLFGATAFHWAAIMGLDRLARTLVEVGAELELADTRYDCTPLQWALHGWTRGTERPSRGHSVARASPRTRSVRSRRTRTPRCGRSCLRGGRAEDPSTPEAAFPGHTRLGEARLGTSAHGLRS